MALQGLDALVLLWGRHRELTKVVDAALGLWTRTVDLGLADETKGGCRRQRSRISGFLLLVLKGARGGRKFRHSRGLQQFTGGRDHWASPECDAASFASGTCNGLI